MASERPLRITCALLFVASAAATVVWSRQCPAMSSPGSSSMAWSAMADRSWPAVAASFLAMWLLMMVAMMLPALVPMLTIYRRSVRARDEERLALPTFVAGAAYFLVWTAVGALAWPLGVAISRAASRSGSVARALPTAAALMVLLAGVVQLSPWKSRQLARCREDPDCCRNLHGEVGVAWRQGLRLGAHCVRCCLPFTLVLLATDVMSLGVMAALTAAITLERLAPRPELVARLLGGGILATAVVLLVKALG